MDLQNVSLVRKLDTKPPLAVGNTYHEADSVSRMIPVELILTSTHGSFVEGCCTYGCHDLDMHVARTIWIYKKIITKGCQFKSINCMVSIE